MKTLQNNFTTPEQSKRLLELGVPAESSDCYYTQEEIEGNMYWFDLHIKREYQPHTSLHASTMWGETLPCWSVGQLIEIYVYLTSYEYVSLIFKKTFTPMDKILDKLEKDIANGMLDFSKLED